jgi:hypothetical protein
MQLEGLARRAISPAVVHDVGICKACAAYVGTLPEDLLALKIDSLCLRALALNGPKRY